MTKYSLPKQGISKEVLETDLPIYLGRDARVLESHVCRACWQAGQYTDVF